VIWAFSKWVALLQKFGKQVGSHVDFRSSPGVDTSGSAQQYATSAVGGEELCSKSDSACKVWNQTAVPSIAVPRRAVPSRARSKGVGYAGSKLAAHNCGSSCTRGCLLAVIFSVRKAWSCYG